jgi:prevent-host-death family protein
VKKTNIAELKNRLSYYLGRVKKGETVLVMERNSPVARIVPIAPPAQMAHAEQQAWLRRMEAQGVLRVGMGKGLAEILTTRPSGKRPAGVVRTLIEDRGRR